jgi:hypothetical protein
VICTAIVDSGFVARVHAAAVRDSAAASWPFAAALVPGADELAAEIERRRSRAISPGRAR